MAYRERTPDEKRRDVLEWHSYLARVAQAKKMGFPTEPLSADRIAVMSNAELEEEWMARLRIEWGYRQSLRS